MTGAAFNIMVRTVKRRMANGESLEDILRSYPKLTADEAGQIREAVSSQEAGNYQEADIYGHTSNTCTARRICKAHGIGKQEAQR